MAKKIILCVLFVSAFYPIMSQQKSDDAASKENDIFQDKQSAYTRSLTRIIAELEKSIEIRLKDLEAKHDQLVVLRPELKNKQTIVTEDIPYVIDEGYESNLYKYISFVFEEGGKVKEIRLGSKKKRIHYEYAYENKTMIFVPPRVIDTKIVLERADRIETTVLNHISYDNQIRALRYIEASLRSSIYRMDVMMVLYKETKDRRNLYQISI
ncbi:MAG: hypothetical protein HS129_01495 [Leptospiraceae bacterium]|nr:hypothetical protein [Leptospiraceae bacterium]NUM40748.1 hypothetical protein [Leptospiraceae bacterium]